MRCSACGVANPDEARFCGACGTSLAPLPLCPRCSAPLRTEQRFCNVCGASLAAPAPEEAAARKVVTIVFADLIGSTGLHERLDAESVRRFMDQYYAVMRGVAEAHGGSVTQLLGDGVKAVFGTPRVAEDDALRAVRAAVAMQRGFRDLASDASRAVGQMGLRVAVQTGEVVAKDETEIIGDPVNVAARLQQEARDGDVLIGESTQRLVGGLVTLVPFGTFALKGRAEPVAAWRVVSLERPAGAPATPFVGREDELRRLLSVYEAAVASPGARLVVILGVPGLGKSRLLDELGRRLGARATLLLARCEATGGATFAPIAESLREHLGLDAGAGRDVARAAIAAALPGVGGDRARIADGVAALLAGTPESPEETFFVVRRLLAGLATARPVVLAIDDLQWAEPLLLDLTEHLVQWSPDVPLLVLAAARPELREARSSFTSPGGLVADVVTLAGLDAVTASRLAASVVGADALPAAIAGRVLATSEGNPLFVGELVRMLVQDGVLRRVGTRWTAGAELSALEMPPTIHALLAARIERLRPEERTVLERAAVVGRQFSRQAVAQLLPPELTDLDARLEALRRSEFVEPDTGWLLGEPLLRFHHALIRDAAYRRLLKATRAELHERFADWLEGRVGPEALEHDETLGWHLEQAHQHLCELGTLDERGRALGKRASRRLAVAGRRALARDDLPLAANLLGRALERLDPADPARAELALDGCEALLAAGEVGRAAEVIDELGRLAGGSQRLRAWHTCFAGELAALTDPKSLRATAGAVAAAAEALATLGDAAGEAKAHAVHATALGRLGQVGASEAALDRALAAARRARDRRRSNAVLAGAPLAALWGPGPVARASGRCLDVVRVLRITQGVPGVEAVALRCQAVLEALRGRSDAARRMIASSRRMVEELGITQGLLETDYFAGLVALIEGDVAAAERSLRAAYEGLRGQGLGIDAARAAAHLARPLLAQGRAAEAEALSRESEALAGDDLDAAITWRRVRAEALARRGEHVSAVELARAAVGIAAATDAHLHHADARLALGAALRAAGRPDEAAAEEARAIELWQAKGATRLAERARRGVGSATELKTTPARHDKPVSPRCRRVRANAATAHVVSLDTAMAARDADVLATLFADEMEVVDHPTGSVIDRQGTLNSLRSMLRTPGLAYRHELLATLGDSLGLICLSVSGSAAAGERFDVGAYEIEKLDVVEVDPRGRGRRVEDFAPDRLGDAVARLYERHAELLPEGPERDRAAATARTTAVYQGLIDLERYNAAWASNVEFADRRTIGVGSARGRDAYLELLGTLVEAATNATNRVDDVLALQPDAWLLRITNSGTDRTTGGAYERPYLMIAVFGADGLTTRNEQFNVDREGEALARFDELTAGPPAPPPTRSRVRPNGATASEARLEAAVAARDADAIAAHVAKLHEVVDYQRAANYDREGSLATWRGLLRACGGTYRSEPLATLGDSLALCRQSVSGSGVAGEKWDVGAYEMENLVLAEVDAQEGRRRTEIFAAGRLGDSIARLYERYAELLPDGPEKVSAAANAHLVATWNGPLDFDRHAAALAPSIEVVDHRTLGTWSMRGADALVAQLRSWPEVADDVNRRAEAVLALRADALLARWTHFGIDRSSGGAYERPFLLLWTLGADGRATHWELFDPDRETEALTRFDDLVVELPSPRIENAAIRAARRGFEAWQARDWERLASLFPVGFRHIDRRPLIWLELDRDGWLASNRRLVAMTSGLAWQVLATRGERLGMMRVRWEGSERSTGPSEIESLAVVELDGEGDPLAVVEFDSDDLDTAYEELDARYAAGEGAAYAPVASAMGGFVRAIASREWEALATLLSPELVVDDHGPLSWETLHGPARYVESLKAVVDLAPDVRLRGDHMSFSDRAALRVDTWVGTRDGGAFEAPRAVVFGFDGSGRIRSVDLYQPEQLEEARARFAAELRREPGG